MIRRRVHDLQPGDVVRRGDGYETVVVEAVEDLGPRGTTVHFAVDRCRTARSWTTFDRADRTTFDVIAAAEISVP